MNWVEHAIWWHVYPLGFTGAPIRDGDRSPAPRLRRLLNWLDYAVELGASGLLLGPIFSSASHGYDSLDQLSIDPRLGGDADFDDLVAACRQRGLRLVLDGVFSHVSADHPLLRRALGEGPDGEVGSEARSRSLSVRVTSSFWIDISLTASRRALTSPWAMACASCGEDARAVTSMMRLLVGVDSVTAPATLLRSIPVEAATWSTTDWDVPISTRVGMMVVITDDAEDTERVPSPPSAATSALAWEE